MIGPKWNSEKEQISPGIHSLKKRNQKTQNFHFNTTVQIKDDVFLVLNYVKSMQGTGCIKVVSYKLQLLYPWGRVPGTHWRESWVGPRTLLDDVVKRKSRPYKGLQLHAF
jgi:hypothetical protein